MRRTRLVATATALVALVAPSGAVGSDLAPPDAPHLPDRVLVKFDPDAGSAARTAALAAVGGSVELSIPRIGWDVVRVPLDLGVTRAMARLARAGAVAAVEPDYTGTVALDPNDRCFLGCIKGARQWNLGAVNALAGWDAFPGRFYTAAEKKLLPQVKVAVLDTKIDLTLADWANAAPSSADHGYDAANGGQIAAADAADFVDTGAHFGSATYHGSFVAGILGAAANNGTDIAGLGYRATIVPVTVVDGNGATNAGWLAAGIDHAVSVGARVINLSLGMAGSSGAVQDAILRATAAGVLVVAAAGNGASNQPFYPAWYDEVMAVTAVDHVDRPGTCTNFSSHTSVAAPGVGILSLDPTQPEKLSIAPCGTSTAAPHVSALAALLFAQSPSRTPAQVRAIIERNADEDRFLPGDDEYFGAGRINVERALRDGVHPAVDGVRASFPKNTGGTSVLTATATAPAGVRAAEYFVGSVGAPGTGTPLVAADGSFGGTTEQLRASIDVPIGFETGVHRVFVRAHDGTRWGAASVGVLMVDREAPRISDFTIAPTALAVAGQGMPMTFRVSDDFSPTAVYTFTVSRALGPASEVVFESEPKELTLPTLETATWQPSPTDVGPYEIKLTVRDLGDNPAYATATTIVL